MLALVVALASLLVTFLALDVSRRQLVLAENQEYAAAKAAVPVFRFESAADSSCIGSALCLNLRNDGAPTSVVQASFALVVRFNASNKNRARNSCIIDIGGFGQIAAFRMNAVGAFARIDFATGLDPFFREPLRSPGRPDLLADTVFLSASIKMGNGTETFVLYDLRKDQTFDRISGYERDFHHPSLMVKGSGVEIQKASIEVADLSYAAIAGRAEREECLY